jgi:hypothetical protein
MQKNPVVCEIHLRLLDCKEGGRREREAIGERKKREKQR